MNSPLSDNSNEISDFAFVGPNVIMGKGNIIREGVIIRDGVFIGNNNYFGPYCVVGEPPEKRGFYDVVGKVTIGNNNRFTGKTTVDSGTERNTVIGDNNLFMKNVHLGHDCIIRDGVTLAVNVALAGWVEIYEDSNLALGVVVHQRCTIPQGVMIGMNGVVTKKSQLAPWSKYIGIPVRYLGPNIK